MNMAQSLEKAILERKAEKKGNNGYELEKEIELRKMETRFGIDVGMEGAIEYVASQVLNNYKYGDRIDISQDLSTMTVKIENNRTGLNAIITFDEFRKLENSFKQKIRRWELLKSRLGHIYSDNSTNIFSTE